MAAMNEPAETALRVNTLRAEPGGGRRRAARGRASRSRGPGRRRAARPGRRARRRSRRRSRSAPGSRPASWCRSRAARRRSSRCSTRSRASACSTSAPGRGSRRPRSPPGSATGGELVSIEVGPAPRRADRGALRARRGRAASRVEVADAAEADLGSGYDRILLDPPCSDLGTLASRPDARWRKSVPSDPERLAALQRRLLVRAARALAPGGTLVYSTCTISERARTRRSAAALGDYASGVEADDLGAAHPRAAPRAATVASCSCCPQRDRTTGFFCARFRRPLIGRSESARSSARTARAAASPGCARPSCPGRYRCVYCLRRYELVSGCPNCGEHQTMVRMSTDEDMLCQQLRPLDAAAGLSAVDDVYSPAPRSRRRSSRPTSRGSARRSAR